MRTPLRFITLVALAVLAGSAVLVASTSRAEWPMARHDRERTGTTTGTGNLTEPAAYFRHYLGGSLSSANMLTFDVDADGADDVLMVTGGRAVARTIEDADLWSSPPRGFSQLIGLADLDGDGARELIVASSNQVFALDPTDGSLLWEEPRGEMGTLGGTRLADFDGDGSMDLLVGECGCCGVNSGYAGAIYTFAAGFAAASKLFEIPEALCGFMRAVTVVEADGAGAPELLLPTTDRLRLYSPSTGAMLAESPPLGSYPFWNRCWPAQLDADPGQEIACFLMENNSSVTNRWRVTVFDYDATGGVLAIAWSEVLAADAIGDVQTLDPIVDLDGDGSQELVVSVALSGVWETRIYDAFAGTREATIPDAITRGHFATAGGRQLVTRSAAGLRGYSYAGTTATPTFALPDHTAFVSWSRAAAAVRERPEELLSLDLDGDGDADLLTTHTTPTSSRLVAYSIEGAVARELESYDIAPGTNTQSAFVIPPVTSANAILAVSYTDGFMVIHDPLLQPAATSGEFEVARLRTGGYYAAGTWRDLSRSAVVAALEAAAPEAIVVGDARGALLRLDATVASWASGPATTWERLGTATPSIVDGLVDGGPGIACFSGGGPTVLTPNGEPRWSVAADPAPLLDLVPGHLDGDAVPDLVFHWGNPSDTLTRTRAVSGVDGSTLWEGTPIESGSGRQPAGIAVGRFDADDRDDVIMQAGATRALSGVTGAELAAFSGPSYYMPTLVNVDSDAEREIVLHGGYSPLQVLDHDLGRALWTSTDDDRPYPYGSVVSCPGDRAVLLSGSWAHASRLKRTELRGGALGTESSAFLAGGRRFGSQAELDAAAVFAGQLTSVAVHDNLAGDGNPAALVGSNDGWLYWVNACDGSLVHAIDMGVAVGQAVFGDTDGDGFDEILVSAADGYLYGFKQRLAESPAWVNDIDPMNPTSTDDVDSVNTLDTLVARWAPVAGVIRYDVGVFEAGGRPLLSPRWQDAGTATDITLSGLALENGHRYFFGVRAISADGPSVDAVSDGAIVRFPVSSIDGGAALDAGPGGPDAGGLPPGDSDCACRAVGAHSATSPAASAWTLVALGLGLVAFRRRKRRDVWSQPSPRRMRRASARGRWW